MCYVRLLQILLIVVLFLSGCTTNPATGRSQFLTLKTSDEIAIGEQSMPGLIQEYGGEVASTQLRNYVTSVGNRLAHHVEPQYQDLPWEFILLDSSVINAFALPGGKVFICRGLMTEFSDEAQLAAVLGHEIGHVTSQHIDERLSHELGVTVLASILTRAVAGGNYENLTRTIVGAGGQGYLLRFSRDQEAEADTQGLKYMTRAGYDPSAMLDIFEILSDASQGARPPEYLSTHPHPETRLETVSRLLDGPYRDMVDNPNYKRFEDRYQKKAKPNL